MTLLSTKQFQKLNLDPTKLTEETVQRMVRKIKSKLTSQENQRLYPSGSRPAKFYGTAKLHKSDSKGLVDDLPTRPIVSNINASTNNLSKYLKFIDTLNWSQHNNKSTKDLTSKIKIEKVPNGYEMVSFDVKSLFTNVPFD